MESNTRYAQGGIAVVTDFLNDNFEKHKQDTLNAGDGLCDETVVDLVVKEGPERLNDLIELGAEFDKQADGKYDLGIEGAHSAPRILHRRDLTGFEMQNTLTRAAKSLANVEIYEHHFAIDLVTQHHLGETVTRNRNDIRCFGAYVMDLGSRNIELYKSRVTVLASGGIGQVYKLTTNPPVATGDGVAMAYRAKAIISQMQFVQFHPTALYGYEGERAFLVSEAVRGFGGILKTNDGREFMQNYDERGSLASRDIVARAIDTEMKNAGVEHVSLDCRHLDIDKFREKFPTIYDTCISIGIDPGKEMIPVAPAAHYVCGGIKTDLNGRSNIENLYCCGEIACTGLHGANRLASNSLLEALVFAERCFRDISGKIDSIEIKEGIPEWETAGTTKPKEKVLINHNRNELRNLMNNYVGIVRSNERLKRSLDRLAILFRETEELYRDTKVSPQLCELRNMINVSYLIIRQSMEQQENRGTYYNIDL